MSFILGAWKTKKSVQVHVVTISKWRYTSHNHPNDNILRWEEEKVLNHIFKR